MREPHLYQPPPGYYDLPMTWLYDASALTDSTNGYVPLSNQHVTVMAGYGDFILRRIVGLNNILSKTGFPLGFPGDGLFQVRDALGRYLQSVPQYVGNSGVGYGTLQDVAADIAVVPELFFRENSQIYFDLVNIRRTPDYSGFSYNGAQLAFQGVRRLKGISPFDPTYNYNLKTYTYVKSLTLPVTTSNQTAIPTQFAITPVVDYDFELHQIQIVYSTPAGVLIPQIVPPYTGTASVPLSLVLLFDQFQVATSYSSATIQGAAGGPAPMPDLYMNGLSYYGNGAIVPPLLYRRDSQIRMQVFSLVGSSPVKMVINYVGKQRIPC